MKAKDRTLDELDDVNIALFGILVNKCPGLTVKSCGDLRRIQAELGVVLDRERTERPEKTVRGR